MQMQRQRSAFAAALLAVASLAGPLTAQPATERIRLNQIGFYPEGPKVAVIVDAPTDVFHVTTPDLQDTVYTGPLNTEKLWSAAQERVRRADFSDLTEVGTFTVVVEGVGPSHPFEIAPSVHQPVATAAIKAYYFMRASLRLEAKYADRWARPAGHPDNQVIVHASAATAARPTGTIISAPKGWYDAGDYNKYIVNSGISVGTLLMLYEHFPVYFGALKTNIPESGNGVPDLLDEVLWNIRWMLDMQDPNDGGVYHKLSTANFEGAVMPNKATNPRYVVQKSTPAALDFAAIMAMGARIYDDFEAELPGLADSMLTAAFAAWNWAQENPEQAYNQNAMNSLYDPDIHTGEYGDNNFFDEFRWAATELFITTRQDSFVVMYNPFLQGNLAAPGWPSVGTMAFFSLAHHRADVAATIDTTEVTTRLVRLANQYFNIKRESAYDMVMGNTGDFYWGSNSLAGNQGVVLLQAYRLTGDDRYLEAAISNLDYLLGRNGTGYSFVTGYGDKTPMHPHHRPSRADGIRDPVPGLLVGGPNSGRQDGCTYPSTLPAKSYVDDWCSYASNEITINWNAPLAYVAGAVEAMLSPTGLPVTTQVGAGAVPGVPGGLQLTSYPNPATGEVRVRFVLGAPAVVTVRVFDVLGREVTRLASGVLLSAGGHERAFDVGGLAAGMYLIHVETPAGSASRSVVVAR